MTNFPVFTEMTHDPMSDLQIVGQPFGAAERYTDNIGDGAFCEVDLRGEPPSIATPPAT
jgi:hypothetical protein